jgi:hypothetical protein
MRNEERATCAGVTGNDVLGSGLLAVAVQGRLLSAAALGFENVSEIASHFRNGYLPSAAQTHSPPSERPQQFLGTTEVIVVCWWCELLAFEVRRGRKFEIVKETSESFKYYLKLEEVGREETVFI